jgi:2-(1,2-epoxy-1,2-dihydrophenyl)acetyl-CoA isomerase
MPDVLLERRGRVSDRLARGPAVALREIKRSVRASLGYTLEQSLAREIDTQSRCWNTQDAREGFAAFLGKREPRYEGR